LSGRPVYSSRSKGPYYLCLERIFHRKGEQRLLRVARKVGEHMQWKSGGGLGGNIGDNAHIIRGGEVPKKNNTGRERFFIDKGIERLSTTTTY